MHPLRSFLPGITLALTLLSCSWTATAQNPAWTPIAELLVGSLGKADPAMMSAVMTRCTALNMTLAGMSADISPEMYDFYTNAAHTMIQHAVLIESQMAMSDSGQEADIEVLSDSVVEEVRQLLKGYGAWMDENVAVGGSYINKDIEMEMESCHLASRLVHDMASSQL